MSFPKRNLEVEHLRLKLVKYELQLMQLTQESQMMKSDEKVS